jgi:hypothetical protein
MLGVLDYIANVGRKQPVITREVKYLESCVNFDTKAKGDWLARPLSIS